MTRKWQVYLLTALATVICTASSQADSISLSKQTLLNTSDRIVYGTYHGKDVPAKSTDSCCGMITVKCTIKPSDTLAHISIKLPRMRASGLQSSVDIAFKDGHQGWWHLQASKDGNYRLPSSRYLVNNPSFYHCPSKD